MSDIPTLHKIAFGKNATLDDMREYAVGLKSINNVRNKS